MVGKALNNTVKKGYTQGVKTRYYLESKSGGIYRVDTASVDAVNGFVIYAHYATRNSSIDYLVQTRKQYFQLM